VSEEKLISMDSRAARIAPCVALTLLLPLHATYAQDARQATTLQPVTVTAGAVGDADLPPVYAGGQVAEGARLGLMGNQSVMDTPFNVTSYTSELIKNQQARTLADVMANDPSVRFTTSSGHAYENFRIRGFDVNQNDVAINGLYGLAPMGRTPVEFVERVEVLKGPNALFSGMAPSGAVGGTVNLVTKRATDTPTATFGVDWLSDGQLGTTIDAGRRFGASNEWGARVNGSFSDGATTLDGQSRKREFLSAGLDYRGSALTASIDAYHSQESFTGGTPAMFWFASPVVPVAPDPRINQFSTAYGSIQSNAIMGQAEYRFNEHVSAFAGVGRRDSDQSGLINGTHARQIQPNGDFTGQIVGQRAYTDATTAEGGLRTRFKTGSVGHELVLQASYLKLEDGSATGPASVFRSNIYNPVTPVMPALPGSPPKTSENTLTSLALVDTMSFLDDKLRVTGGVRNQRVKTSNFDKTGKTTARYDEDAVTPAVAVVVKPWGPDLSFYANYVEGLSKGDSVTDTTATNFGEVFAPYKTKQKELGVKWNAGTFTNTLALFEIDKPMLVTEGSTARPTYADGGEKRVRGVEWNTFGEIAQGVRVLGGVTYTQGTQVKTSYGRYDGNTAVGAPRWQVNTGVEWDTPWVPGLTLTGRIQATSRQYADSANNIEIPGWGQVDLGARYATQINGRDVVLRLNVNNVFNKYYYAGIFSDTTPIATLGPARSVMASAAITF